MARVDLFTSTRVTSGPAYSTNFEHPAPSSYGAEQEWS
jgi:hypothetical protein